MENEDRFDLNRFLSAQAPVIEQVQRELETGRKRSHWMWFIFPQLAGLGSSAMARHYAIRSRSEAEAYLAQPVLGERLKACTRLVNAVKGRTAFEILGSPDDLKFHSSMTLFNAVAPEVPEFSEALRCFFDGRPDPATTGKLAAG